MSDDKKEKVSEEVTEDTAEKKTEGALKRPVLDPKLQPKYPGDKRKSVNTNKNFSTKRAGGR